jgi:hypothetical protein
MEEPYVVIFFWRKKVRNANDGGSSWKIAANKNTHVRDAKYLLLKMPVITLMKKELKRIQKTEIKFNEVQEIN